MNIDLSIFSYPTCTIVVIQHLYNLVEVFSLHDGTFNPMFFPLRLLPRINKVEWRVCCGCFYRYACIWSKRWEIILPKQGITKCDQGILYLIIIKGVAFVEKTLFFSPVCSYKIHVSLLHHITLHCWLILASDERHRRDDPKGQNGTAWCDISKEGAL